MGYLKGVAGALLAAGVVMATPAAAAPAGDAEKLRRLDIMLMVTGLRCRNTSDNFQADYEQFTTRHLRALNAASQQLQWQLSAEIGAAGAHRALDRISTTMANSYGQGHPWLGCADLKIVARSLARAEGTAVLVEAADQLLASQGTPRFAWAR